MVDIAIVYDIVRWEERDLIGKAGFLGVDPALIKVDESPFRVTEADVPRVEADAVLQRCVSFYRALAGTVLLEAWRLKVVNSSTSVAIAADKLWTAAKLYKAGVPMPETVVGFPKQAAVKAAGMPGYPVVVKLILGSWERPVTRADDNDMDRLEAVIGHRWKTYTTLEGKALSARVKPELEEVALKAARAVRAEVAGLDVLEDPDCGFLVSKVNHGTEYRNTAGVTGVDFPSEYHLNMVQEAKR